MIPVNDLYSACQMMLRDKWGYIWGEAGGTWTEKKQKNATREMTVKYGSRWIGHRVADCSGVLVYIWKQHGMSIYHGSNTIRKKYCGPFQDQPKPGYAAFKVRNGDDYYHIGIVAEDGLNVYEARGTQAGFVMSAASSWHVFAPFLDVDYTKADGGDPVEPFRQYRAVVTTQRDPLNVRERPDKSAKVLFKLDRGETVWVMEEKDGWARIEEDGMQGWASMQYLKKESDDAPDVSDDVGEETPAASDGGNLDDGEPENVAYTVLRNKDTDVTICIRGDWEVTEGG